MTTTPPESPAESTDSATDGPPREGPRVSRDEVRDLGRLRRTTGDRKVAGVAGGLARHLDVDPVILRVGFVVLAFFGGAGLILYAAGWALVPEEDRDRAPVHLDERSRTVALIALGVIAALALVGDSWGADWFPWPLAIIGLIAFVWLSRSREGRQNRAAAAPSSDPFGTGSHTTDPTIQHDDQPPAPTRYGAPRPRDPRKGGPILFWFTLLLIAVSEGVLGIVDAAGAPIVDSAYAALATGVIALMLIVGAFMGRAGGLIVLGLISFAVLAGATAADRWDGDRYEYHPRSGDEIAETYSISDGTLVLDLTDLDDPDALDGLDIDVSAGIGELRIRVPEDANIQAFVDIDGPGGYDLFDQQQGGGFSSRTTAQWRSAVDDPSFTIDASLRAGAITIETE